MDYVTKIRSKKCVSTINKDFFGLSVAFYKRVSIIMLQKIAAMMDNVAADLHFMASKVRLLLQKKNFTIAAFSAATFMCLYILL